MNIFTEYELSCYNKVLGAALGKVERSTVTKQEVDITVELLCISQRGQGIRASNHSCCP